MCFLLCFFVCLYSPFCFYMLTCFLLCPFWSLHFSHCVLNGYKITFSAVSTVHLLPTSRDIKETLILTNTALRTSTLSFFLPFWLNVKVHSLKCCILTTGFRSPAEAATLLFTNHSTSSLVLIIPPIQRVLPVVIFPLVRGSVCGHFYGRPIRV
jgi:hypothetical protein